MTAIAAARRAVVVVLIGGWSVASTACGGTVRPEASAQPAATVARALPRSSPGSRPPGEAHATDPGPAPGVPIVSGRNVNQPASVGDPTAVDIPSIGVRSTLSRLGIAPDGAAQVPADPQRAGWFSGGARPGDDGPAVILGHIDSRTGPAVFYRLHQLVPGATVTVTTTSGRRVAFTVERVQQVSKQAFPTADVYGPAFGRQLRLVTCGGSFDRSKGHYTDNVIVYLTAAKGSGRS